MAALDLSRVQDRVEVLLDSGLTVSVVRGEYLGLHVAVVTPRRVVRSWEGLTDARAEELLANLSGVLDNL